MRGERNEEMSSNLIGRSSGTSTSCISPELHRIRDQGRSQHRKCTATIRIRVILPRNEPKKLKFASPSSIPSFASKIRAQSAQSTKSRGESLYELLGIPESVSAGEIKRAYKEMARRYHPDVCPAPDRTEEYTRLFIQVHQAYETLSDPNRRAIYDRDLAGGFNLAFSSRRKPFRSNCDEVSGYKSVTVFYSLIIWVILISCSRILNFSVLI